MANKSKQGKDFENILKREFEVLYGPTSTIVKTDPPVKTFGFTDKNRFTGCFAAPGQCDFEGSNRGIAFCFDAKDTSAQVFLKDRIKNHQWERMALTWESHGLSGIFLRFKMPNANLDGIYGITFPQLEKMFAKKKRFSNLELVAIAEPFEFMYAGPGRLNMMPQFLLQLWHDRQNELWGCKAAKGVV